MERLPEGQPYLIPVRLDDCPIPERLAHIHCGELRSQSDLEKLVKALFASGTRRVSAKPAFPVNYSRLRREFELDTSIILPGYGASRVHLGATEDEVSELVGVPSDVSTYEDCMFWGFHERGIAFRFCLPQRHVETIFVYHAGVEGFSSFVGNTPEGISVASTRADVEAAFGRPTVVGGEGLIPFWAAYDLHGLAITYNTNSIADRTAVVHHIDVCQIGSW
jgi:hypothetical protein